AEYSSVTAYSTEHTGHFGFCFGFCLSGDSALIKSARHFSQKNRAGRKVLRLSMLKPSIPGSLADLNYGRLAIRTRPRLTTDPPPPPILSVGPSFLLYLHPAQRRPALVHTRLVLRDVALTVSRAHHIRSGRLRNLCILGRRHGPKVTFSIPLGFC